jgi:uncharacterized protein
MSESELENLVNKLVEEQRQLTELVGKLAETKPRGKDRWDKFSALSTFVSSVLIAAIGLWFTTSYTRQQGKKDEDAKAQQNQISKVQVIAQLMPFLTGSEQNKQYALVAISALGDTSLAARIASLTPTQGSATALRSISESGATEEDRKIATEALRNLRIPALFRQDFPNLGPITSGDLSKNSYESRFPEVAQRADLVAMQEILNHGVDVNYSDEGTKRTPLMWAAEAGRAVSAKFLLDKGANPNLRSSVDPKPLPPGMCGHSGGETALNYAAAADAAPSFLAEIKPEDRDYLSTIKELVAHNADLNLQDGTGSTPLMTAANRGQTAIAKFLVSKGAGLCLKSCSGETAAQIARKFGHPEIAQDLEKSRCP